MIASNHKRDTALRGIVSRLNAARAAALTTAKDAYAAANPGADIPDYPRGGPVLPECLYDDPTEFDPAPGKIARDLRLFTQKVARGPAYVGEGRESEPTAMLEWMIMVPAEQRDHALDIRETGIAEIEAALGPSETRLEDPDTGAALALTFEFGDPDFQTHDLGQAWVMAVYIPLLLTLDAATVLS